MVEKIRTLFKNHFVLIGGSLYAAAFIAVLASALLFFGRTPFPSGPVSVSPPPTFHLEAYRQVDEFVGVPYEEIVAEDESPEPAEEKGEEAALNPSLVDVAVLNGTSAPGAAAELSGRLEEAGFSVLRIGNASLREGTVIQIKESFQQYTEQLRSAVEEQYSVAEVQELSESEDADAAVIIGL